MSIVEAASIAGSLGEFIGAIAVVVTLVYLARQVKLSKDATEANTRQMEEARRLGLVDNYLRRSERVERGYRDTALTPEIAEIVFKAYREEELGELDTYRLREWCHAHMHQLDAQHFQYQQGFLEEEAYQNLRETLARFAPIWQNLDVRPVRASFREEVEDVLREIATDPD